MRDIAAHPVTIGGNHFRSMTEARFGVAMSALGVDWRYEPGVLKVGTDSNGAAVWYVPDFVLPELHVHIELKPSWDFIVSHQEELRKPARFGLWPLPIMVWLWDDEIGFYFDDGRGIYLMGTRFVRCERCNRIVLVGEDAALYVAFAKGERAFHGDDAYLIAAPTVAFQMPGLAGQPVQSVNHACGVPALDLAPWNRAMALARGWRPVA